MERAYGYVRVSGKGQLQGDGFARQEAAIRAYAAQSGVEVVSVFQECASGVAGADADKWHEDRPAYFEMLEAILKNGVRTIIVEGLDRLARTYAVQEQLLVHLAAKRVRLLSARTEEDVTEAIKADPMKKALIQIQAVFAELEKGLLVNKLRAARERRKAQLGKCEGRPGYRDTEEGRQLIEEIKRLRVKPYKGKRKTLPEIATILNERGISTMTGRPWTGFNVQRFLKPIRKVRNKGGLK